MCTDRGVGWDDGSVEVIIETKLECKTVGYGVVSLERFSDGVLDDMAMGRVDGERLLESVGIFDSFINCPGRIVGTCFNIDGDLVSDAISGSEVGFSVTIGLSTGV